MSSNPRGRSDVTSVYPNPWSGFGDEHWRALPEVAWVIAMHLRKTVAAFQPIGPVPGHPEIPVSTIEAMIAVLAAFGATDGNPGGDDHLEEILASEMPPGDGA